VSGPVKRKIKLQITKYKLQTNYKSKITNTLGMGVKSGISLHRVFTDKKVFKIAIIKSFWKS
jgi:hypothetical protein